MVVEINSYLNFKQPSFGAIHPTRHFIKNTDNTLTEIVDRKTVESLQRKLVLKLNRDYNATKKKFQGHCYSPAKPENSEEKALREKLVNFFKNRDEDYREKSLVRSFNTTNSFGMIEPYIITGKSLDIIEKAALPIEQVWKDAQNKAEVLSSNLGITFENAKLRILDETKNLVSAAKRFYHFEVLNKIKSILAKNDLKNSHFDAIYEVRTKGNKINYKIIDAKFNGS